MSSQDLEDLLLDLGIAFEARRIGAEGNAGDDRSPLLIGLNPLLDACNRSQRRRELPLSKNPVTIGARNSVGEERRAAGLLIDLAGPIHNRPPQASLRVLKRQGAADLVAKHLLDEGVRLPP